MNVSQHWKVQRIAIIQRLIHLMALLPDLIQIVLKDKSQFVSLKSFREWAEVPLINPHSHLTVRGENRPGPWMVQYDVKTSCYGVCIKSIESHGSQSCFLKVRIPVQREPSLN